VGGMGHPTPREPVDRDSRHRPPLVDGTLNLHLVGAILRNSPRRPASNTGTGHAVQNTVSNSTCVERINQARSPGVTWFCSSICFVRTCTFETVNRCWSLSRPRPRSRA